MHLDREGARFGLALPLAAGTFSQAGEVLLAYGHVTSRVTRAGIVDQNFEVHLGFTPKAFNIGLKMTLIGANRAAKRVVVLKGGAKAEGQDSGQLEAVCDNAGVVFGGLLVQPLMVFGAVLGDDHGQVTGGKKECLITEEA